MYLGFPLGVISLQGEGIVIKSLQFLVSSAAARERNLFSTIPASSRRQVLLHCQDGSVYLATVGGGREVTTVKLTDASEDPECIASAVEPALFMDNLVLAIFRNGSVSLLDGADGNPICQLTLPPSHMLADPWDPVFALDAETQTLILRGDKRLCADELVEGKEPASSLFLFHLSTLPSVEAFSSEQKKVSSPAWLSTWERRCELFLQERLRSVGERNKEIMEGWSQLKGRADIVQQTKKIRSRKSHT
ncbi:WD repeat-containing protein 93-like [Latimeria chalumnae]|uniref:WD repeat-containing protein 93-like n=1 Tax=Latimeria chalumnae TaxID=7897 RepID=UPI0003C17C83|nr:PREDICTED: WD repeat-containing protein 93-like [Latimeria chalumnae]|eukprot:XP_005989842.1 PREDICTED: WD repeat-containing protein 93-like [Latimeria chalumnae]